MSQHDTEMSQATTASSSQTETMSNPLLIRDVMRIGVPTCKLEDTVAHVAALMIDGGHTAVVVLDEEADTPVGSTSTSSLRHICAQRLPLRMRPRSRSKT